MLEGFAVFILTHGRPNKVVTYDTLRRQGYTGPVYIIIDNEDKTADEYRKRYGDQVIMFDKAAIAQTFDEGDNFQDRRAVIYARNASFQIARDLGLEWFLQLDDDYTAFVYKFNANMVSGEWRIKSLDEIFSAVLEYYRNAPITSIAFAQNGDIFGGKKSGNLTRAWMKRKAMNTFFCSPDRPFMFNGRINEDVNTYVSEGNRGRLFFTFFNASIIQTTTQASAGGMTELYLAVGTYIKSFYTVMYSPSCVRVYMMGGFNETANKRLHHKITWADAVPCIVGEHHRKASSVPASTGQ